MNITELNEEESNQIAKEIAEVATQKMEMIFTKINKKDTLLIQGYVCDLLASYFLSTTIRILIDGKISDKSIETMCKGCVERAFLFSEKAEFRYVREH